MINNIKMKTKSILQSFQYTERVNILLYYGQGTKTLQIIQPLSSFHNQAQMHPPIIWYKLMKPIEKTIHSQMMDSKHKLLFTLVLPLLFLFIGSHGTETTGKNPRHERLGVFGCLITPRLRNCKPRRRR